jgi:putative phosphoesterase
MRDLWPIEKHTTADVVLAADRPTCVGIVSDTHGEPHRATVGLLAELKADVLLHGGDVGGYPVLTALRPTAPQVIAVRGNIDGRAFDLPDAVTIRFLRGGAEVMRWLLLHVGVNGPKLRSEVRALAVKEGADVVVCGHSHMPLIARDGGVAIFNPGSVGPRRFGLPIVFGVATIAATGLSFGHVSCETGQAWRP